MDVTKMLESDHRQVEQLFSKIEKAQGGQRMPLIDELSKSLRAHMELEEKVVYPSFEPVVGHEPIEEGNKEHELARKSLDEMIGLAPDEPGFGAALEAVKAGVTHHVEEEEGQVFPKVRKQGKRALDEIATPFMKTRVELGMPMEASALAAASSKDELLSEAQQAGVDRASSMTKDDLAKALVAKMS